MKYKIALIADDHLDYSYGVRTDARGVNLRVLDGYRAFHERMDGIISHEDKIDAVLHAGDLFHTPKPSVRSIMTLKHYMKILKENDISWWGVSGNHDTSDNRSMIPATAVVDDPERNIYSLWKPYEKNEISDQIFLHTVGYHGLSKDEAPEIEPVDDALNIFMAHGAAVDPSNKTLMNCIDSPREQLIPPDLIVSDAFDFRALGHYHSRYAVGGPELKTWYAGSSLRRGFSDEVGARGWILITIDDDGTITADPKDIWQRPQYDLPVIDATEYKTNEIQEIIMGNIRSTRTDETKGQFNEVEAPIVRQKIINATGAVRQSLDIPSIKEATGHMLSWKLEFTPPEMKLISPKVSNPSQETEDIDEQGFSKARKGTNIVTGFESWIKESYAYSTMEEKEREKIKVTASKFLQEAQDLDDEFKEAQQ